MVFITAYTKGNEYERAALKLEQDFIKYKLNYKLFGYQDQGDWKLNTMQKPKFVMKALELFPNDDITWIDADAVILKDPDFLKNLQFKDYDICCHYLCSEYNPHELLTGTIAFKNNEKVRNLVDIWSKKRGFSDQYEQSILQNLIDRKFRNKFLVLSMPEEYIKIKPQNVSNIKELKCVIGHDQLSRKYRKEGKRSLFTKIIEKILRSFNIII
jgi:hypothetical protein